MPKPLVTCGNRTLDAKLNAFCKLSPETRCVDVPLEECQFKRVTVKIKEVETCLSSELEKSK